MREMLCRFKFGALKNKPKHKDTWHIAQGQHVCPRCHNGIEGLLGSAKDWADYARHDVRRLASGYHIAGCEMHWTGKTDREVNYKYTTLQWLGFSSKKTKLHDHKVQVCQQPWNLAPNAADLIHAGLSELVADVLASTPSGGNS